MANFKKEAIELLDAIGGKENIKAVTHCMTRMRLVLHDTEKADTSRIEDLEPVKGTFTQSGQFQVIIGNKVSDFYNDFANVSGVEGVSKDEVKEAGQQNQHWAQRLIATLAEIFTPLIPAIIIGGLILGFTNILGDVPFEFLNGATIADTYTFWGGVNEFLELPAEAIFQFLPVGIAWSVTKKMGTTQILGLVLGITLVSPQLLNAYEVAETAATELPTWNFGFWEMPMRGYQGQVIPAILAAFVLVYLEKWVRKLIPEAVSMIFVPLFALVPTIFVSHAIIGPIGWTLGEWLSTGVQWGLTGTFNWIFGLLFGGFYPALVITGLHHMSHTIDLQLIAAYNGTILWPMIALANIAQGSAVLGIIFMHRGNKKEEAISIPSWISAWLGVTEPALFGINIKFVYPFIAGMIGSAIAGMLSVALNVTANAIGIGGLPGILSIQPTSMLNFIICAVVAMVIPFVLVIFFEKKNILTKFENNQLPIPKLGK